MDPLELDALLHGDMIDTEGDEYDVPAPVPADQSLAAWHNRKGSVFRAQAATEKALFDEAIAEIAARCGDRMRVLERAAGWHEQAVEAWHRENVKTVGKTVTFPVGPRSELRGSAPLLQVFDDDKLRAWLADRHDPETGESWESKVWRRPPEQFMASALKAVIEVPKKKGGREPNEVVSPVAKVGGEEVPGVRAIIVPDRWQRGGK